MRRAVAIPVTMLAVAFQFAIGQHNTDPVSGRPTLFSSFLGKDAQIPEGYTLRISLAYPPYERGANFMYGVVSLGINGLLEATLSREGAIGTPIGVLKPVSLVGLRVQLVPQHDLFPGVSAFLTTMTESKLEFLGNIDLKPNLPELFQRGVLIVQYEAKTTAAGLGFAAQPNNLLSINAGFGVREIVWRQGWSLYAVDIRQPRTQDGWTLPLPERSALRLDWSAGAAFQPIPQLTFIGEVAALPFAEIDASSLLVEMREGYMGAIGVRYRLPVSLSVDLYDRWFSERGDRTNYHQVRLGLSTAVAFNEPR